MRLYQMFSRPTLDPEDLYAFNAGVTPVTIHRIIERPVGSRIGDEVEYSYLVKTREFLKPFKLNPVNGQQLAEVLGTDNSTLWIGRVVGILPCKIWVPTDDGAQKQVWVVNFAEEIPRHAPSKVLDQDITGLARDGSTARCGRPGSAGADKAVDTLPPDMTPLGIESAAELSCLLEERGRKWEDLRLFLISRGHGSLINGMMPFDCPNAIRPATQVFLQGLPIVARKPAREKFKHQWAPPAPEPGEPPITIPLEEIPY
ncbi:MAG: hypothetical protein IT435_20660 [Phycisphaerales bacterium]|nr:hypothetical protein [Phycisphaerales bacterium]